MNQLPLDVHVEISRYLATDDIIQLAQANVYLSQIYSGNPIWKFQCPDLPGEDKLATFKRTQLVPVYRCQTDPINTCTPFAYLKVSALRGNNQFLTHKLFSDSLLIVANDKFEYLWTVVMVRNKIYTHLRQIKNTPLAALWITRMDRESGRLLTSYERSEEIRYLHFMAQRYDVQFRNLLDKFRPYAKPITRDLCVLNGLNIVVPTEFRANLVRLSQAGNCIIFCHPYTQDSKRYCQVAFMSPGGRVGFAVVTDFSTAKN